MKFMSKAFFHSNTLDWEELGGGISRQIFGYDDSIMIVKLRFKKGSIGTPHLHDIHSQSSYVSSGKFEVTIDGVTETLVGGDGFYMKPESMHGVKCLEDGVLIDGFSPLREDFLKK